MTWLRIIVNLSDHEDLCFLLLPSVPLARFRMYASHVWDQNRTRNLRGTVGLLIAHYTNTLGIFADLNNNVLVFYFLIIRLVFFFQSKSNCT